LFAATSVIWGSSFLFIRMAVAHLPPSAVVFGRTVLGAVLLVPLAARSRAFRGIRPLIVPITMVAALDMAGPTFLTAWGEQHLSSSAAGILTATDPLFTAVLALALIRSEAPGRRQLAGLIIGFAGVIALLGMDFRGSAVELAAAGAVLLSALGYAGAALIYRRWLDDVPAIGVTAFMTVISSLAFLAPATVNPPRQIPPASSILALATLGIINTGVAYWLFYLLIDQAGAATASVITYVMPVVALFLGVGLLGERLTAGAIIGLILIGAGAWLATSRKPSSTSGEQKLDTVPSLLGDVTPKRSRGRGLFLFTWVVGSGLTSASRGEEIIDELAGERGTYESVPQLPAVCPSRRSLLCLPPVRGVLQPAGPGTPGVRQAGTPVREPDRNSHAHPGSKLSAALTAPQSDAGLHLAGQAGMA
jgi:drug/metabolite transporter (DMT)-like permease